MLSLRHAVFFFTIASLICLFASTCSASFSEHFSYVDCRDKADFIKAGRDVANTVPDGEIFFYFPTVQLSKKDGKPELNDAVAARITSKNFSYLVFYLQDLQSCVIMDTLLEADYGSTKGFETLRKGIEPYTKKSLPPRTSK